MSDDGMVFFLLIGYIFVTYILIRFLKRKTQASRPLTRVTILSFIYSLLWGVGIAGSGGDPGFALPAPNLLAIILMWSDGLYTGVISGLILWGIWWILLFLIIGIKEYLRAKKSAPSQIVNNSSHKE